MYQDFFSQQLQQVGKKNFFQVGKKILTFVYYQIVDLFILLLLFLNGGNWATFLLVVQLYFSQQFLSDLFLYIIEDLFTWLLLFLNEGNWATFLLVVQLIIFSDLYIIENWQILVQIYDL
eukprot:TRINITY_DN21248_c0_g1_i4.p4 TRINITY_DN21248_c0_g1~~TRINITY_DN21248_c0_g1_i4.p4  ORF type:complete len:120 (-),score=9.14 TRINITY_DN21248_c0_g1_i4:36-395(-)